MKNYSLYSLGALLALIVLITLSSSCSDDSPSAQFLDTTTVFFDQLTDGSEVRGTILLKATVDEAEVKSVAFFVDSVRLGVKNSAPFEVIWNTYDFPDGAYTLSLEAIDNEHNMTTNEIQVFVKNAILTVVPGQALVDLNDLFFADFRTYVFLTDTLGQLIGEAQVIDCADPIQFMQTDSVMPDDFDLNLMVVDGTQIARRVTASRFGKAFEHMKRRNRLAKERPSSRVFASEMYLFTFQSVTRGETYFLNIREDTEFFSSHPITLTFTNVPGDTVDMYYGQNKEVDPNLFINVTDSSTEEIIRFDPISSQFAFFFSESNFSDDFKYKKFTDVSPLDSLTIDLSTFEEGTLFDLPGLGAFSYLNLETGVRIPGPHIFEDDEDISLPVGLFENFTFTYFDREDFDAEFPVNFTTHTATSPLTSVPLLNADFTYTGEQFSNFEGQFNIDVDLYLLNFFFFGDEFIEWNVVTPDREIRDLHFPDFSKEFLFDNELEDEFFGVVWQAYELDEADGYDEALRMCLDEEGSILPEESFIFRNTTPPDNQATLFDCLDFF